MEILTTIVSLVFVLGLILSPIIILYRLNKREAKYKFFSYLILGIITTATISFAFAWWVDASNQMLLSHYGYNSDTMPKTERLAEVSAENMERVKSLRISTMGIGWPLKAIMSYLFYSPYLLLVYLVAYIVESRTLKRKSPRLP